LTQHSNKTLLLGLGNPLSGDDCFGSQVIERLQNEAELPPDVTLINAHTDLLNYLEDFAKYDRVILIDAILDTERKLGEPGRVLLMEEASFQSWPEESQSVHQMSPLLATKLFRTLHPEAQTKIILVGLLVDQLTHEVRFATEARIHEAILILLNPSPAPT
jgi:hydrogenase maturation protease